MILLQEIAELYLMHYRILILFYMENYKRLNVDENKEVPDDIKKSDSQDCKDESRDDSIKINNDNKTVPTEKTPLINQ